jgi:hypothetical protein
VCVVDDCAYKLRRMVGLQIIDDEICYKFEEYKNVFEVYHARATMHDAVYLHRCPSPYPSPGTSPSKVGLAF